VSSISDPGRPSRGDRRKVQKLIDTAYANGQVSAAERALRTQRIDAAHTRGDLAMIARDLGGPTGPAPAADPAPPVVQDLSTSMQKRPDGPSLGSAIDPEVLRSMQVGGPHRGGGGTTGLGMTPTINLATAARKIRLVIVIVAVVVLGFCGLGVFAFIPAFMEGFDSGVSSSQTAVPEKDGSGFATTTPGEPARNASLHSAPGWKALVDAVRDESGSTSVYDLVVYPTYASVGLDGGKYVERRLYRDGAWEESFNVRTPAVGNPVDLSAIDPRVIAKLPVDAAQRLGIEHPAGTYFIVNALLSEPKIMVYLQTDGGSQYQTYTLEGTPRSP
jgi:hypothetical protein